MRPGAATVVDLAAYLGVTPRRVRQLVKDHSIRAVGTRWKAKLYDPALVIAAAQRTAPVKSGGRVRAMVKVRLEQDSMLLVNIVDDEPESVGVAVEVSEETAARWKAAAEAWAIVQGEIDDAWRGREFYGRTYYDPPDITSEPRSG